MNDLLHISSFLWYLLVHATPFHLNAMNGKALLRFAVLWCLRRWDTIYSFWTSNYSLIQLDLKSTKSHLNSTDAHVFIFVNIKSMKCQAFGMEFSCFHFLSKDKLRSNTLQIAQSHRKKPLRFQKLAMRIADVFVAGWKNEVFVQPHAFSCF